MSSRLEGEPETVLNLAPSVLARLRGETEILTRIEGGINYGGSTQLFPSGTVGVRQTTAAVATGRANDSGRREDRIAVFVCVQRG